MTAGVHATAPIVFAPRQGRRPAARLVLAALAMLAGITAVLGGIAAVNYFEGINRLSRSSDGIVEVTAPNARTLVVYYEGQTSPSRADLEVRVADAYGRTIPLRPYGYDLRYDVGERVGQAVGSFEAPAAGRYIVSAGIQEPGARLAVGSDLGTPTILFVAAMVMVPFVVGLGLLVALVLLLGRAPRRRSETIPGYQG